MRARLASGNPHKLVELRRALPGWEIELVLTREFPPETGSTYEENARGKALHGRATEPADAWVIGEDSGIEAAALGGRPGIESARWDEDGVDRMLRELDGLGERAARYVCVIVALGPAGEEIVAEGTLEGTIASTPAGAEGFGYDPIFVPTGEERTVAELGNEWKRGNSHRARAAAALAEALETRPKPGRQAEACRGAPASVGAMDAHEALAELTSLSTQVEEAAILGGSGFVLASTGSPERGERLARVAADMLAAAAVVRPASEVSRVEVVTETGGVFVVVEGGRTAVATTVPEPTAGLVIYDLRTALRRLAEEPAPEKAKPKTKKEKEVSDA